MAEDDNDVESRIAVMEAELKALKSALKTHQKPEGRLVDLDQMLANLDEESDIGGTMELTSDTARRAETLFTGLLEKRRLVSYAKAYELLFGAFPAPFRNAIHVPRVIEVALRTAPRKSGGLEVRLDSLIVSIRNRQPGPGHFRTAPYTLNEWNGMFGSWSLVQ